MRKFLVLLPLLVLPVSALAQDAQQTPAAPRVELFGGYSFMGANMNASNFNMNGVNLSMTENLNSWFGGTLDMSAHFGTENALKTNIESLTYGPVFSYRKIKNVVPFAHGLLGAVRGGPNYLNISQPEERFGAYVGGGLDVKVKANLAIRVVQADYLMTRFSNARQDNIRLSAGIIFYFGKCK
jgi:hypothetical protein